MNFENLYRILFQGALIWFTLLILIMLLRAVTGPRITDRILSINMIGTMVISSVCILSFVLDESYLLDVALIYAMISFVAVLILNSTYIPRNPSRKKFLDEMKEGNDQNGQKERASVKAAEAGSIADTDLPGETGEQGEKGENIRRLREKMTGGKDGELI
ncbi:MAG: hypothetical protein IJH81_07910 [Lachnospiraceae bacterium]|nr:hypothetical protein [Lachnospiraceae bacterium]